MWYLNNLINPFSFFPLVFFQVQYKSRPADAVRSDSRLLRQLLLGDSFPELKMCGYNGKKMAISALVLATGNGLRCD